MSVKTVDVYNSRNGDEETFIDHTPREAVIAAYAQSVGDWDTSSYEREYGRLVKRIRTKWVYDRQTNQERTSEVKWVLAHFFAHESTL